MGSLNKVTLLGNVGQDAELKFTNGGKAVVNLSLATNENYTNKAGVKVTATEWHRIQLWGERASVLAQYLTKGKQILVEGKLKTRSYEKDGVKHFVTEIVASNVQLLGAKKTAESNAQDSIPDEEIAEQDLGESDIPY